MYNFEQAHDELAGGITADAGGDVEIHVRTHPHQREQPVAVVAEIDRMLRVTAVLEPDEARSIAETLLDAADSVEDWREDNPIEPSPGGTE